MRMIANPYDNGAQVDYDSIPDFSHSENKPGKYDPKTGSPMDETALKHFHFCYGNEQANNRLREFYVGKIAEIEAQLEAKAITKAFDSAQVEYAAPGSARTPVTVAEAVANMPPAEIE